MQNNPRLMNLAEHLLAPIDEVESKDRSVIQAVGNDVQVLQALGLMYQLSGRENEAIGCWQQILQFDSENEAALYWLQQHYHDRGRFDLAAGYLDRLIKINPYNTNLWGRRAHILGQQGDLLAAIEAGEKGLQLDPANLKLRSWIVQAYAVTDQPEKSQQQAEVLERLKAVANRAREQ